VAGQNPAVSGPTGFASFTNGVSTGTDFSWPEVGIVTLTPHIKDSDYLGAGDVTGTTSGNVGRFIPNDFLVTKNVPTFQTACAAGGFTYIGQSFTYATAPVLSVTARALGGATTRNYTGAFFKLTNSSLTSRTYSAVAATLDTTGLPATTSDPAITDLTNGLAALTFSAGTGLAISRSTPVVPFNAQISLSINVIDSDSVAAINPVSFSSMAFSSGSEQRYGRIAFRNAVGSELLNLPLPMHAEYFKSTTDGFVQSSVDSCTTGVSLAFGSYGGNLNSGETCILDTGSPGVSGIGCSVAGPVGQQFKMPPVAGDFIAILRAPGAGNDGTVTVTTVVPSWLRFDWDVATPGLENPSGIATFGIFKGDAKRIFQTEK
jgi:MSHA biogenesis protein MshQ